MLTTSGLAATAALIGDPARANMLIALMDGRALTATELAEAAGITRQTASTHLARLTQSHLLVVEQQGRHRYHRLASAAVAQIIEGMMTLTATANSHTGARVVTGPTDHALRRARSCYDHLAGRVAVAIADRMVEQGQVEFGDGGGVLTPLGSAFLRDIEVDVPSGPAGKSSKRTFCRPCLDWSERRPHIAGSVGAALLSTCLAKGWLRRVDGSRAVTVTPGGRVTLDRLFGLDASIYDG